MQQQNLRTHLSSFATEINYVIRHAPDGLRETVAGLEARGRPPELLLPLHSPDGQLLPGLGVPAVVRVDNIQQIVGDRGVVRPWVAEHVGEPLLGLVSGPEVDFVPTAQDQDLQGKVEGG